MKKLICIMACILTVFTLFACSSNNVLSLKPSEQETTTIVSTKTKETTKVVETTKAEETIKVVEASKVEETTKVIETTEQTKQSEVRIMGKPKVEISIKDYGKIQLELEPEIAPITVENFLTLVNSGFYNGLTFHRIIKGFMMQGGDPKGTGSGGSDKEIKGEFNENGVNNPISHVRGVISMARRGDNNDSASSQFFIVHQDSDFLDGKYAAFGRVISGMDVVDKVCDNAKVVDKDGRVASGFKPVIEYIKVIE